MVLVSTLEAPISVILDAPPRLFQVLSTALQGGCFYYQLIVEATKAQRRNGVPQGYTDYWQREFTFKPIQSLSVSKAACRDVVTKALEAEGAACAKAAP